ncbi:MAG: peptidylprolyl isomerase [Pseudomonadales bacterium]|nr:peptidylprolyl isomerase [Pseudomonadales bacterium]
MACLANLTCQRIVATIAALGYACIALAAAPSASPPARLRTTDAIVASAQRSDWRANDLDNTLYLQLDTGRVVMELAPRFAPAHVANIKKLVAAQYFDGLAIARVQDNFVVQWGDPDGKRSTGAAARTLRAEFDRADTADLPFNQLPDRDGYAAQVGFSESFPAARDRNTHRAWLTHCYATLGVGRDNAADSGGGTELYVVIGHAPRQLDRNVTVVGRVLQGIELLSSLPRGTAAMGMYETPAQRIPIRSIRLASNVPPEQRTSLEILRTDTATFQELIESRRNRPDAWYINRSGYIDLCNVPIPVRQTTAKQAPR